MRYLLHTLILIIWLGTFYLAYAVQSFLAILLCCVVFHLLVRSNERLVRDGLLP